MLVAIAIPVFTAQLEKSRDATTVANLRSAFAEATALVLSEPDSTDASAGNAKKTGANKVEVSDVKLPCTDGNADVSDLPFSITLASKVPADEATVEFEFKTDGTVAAAIK